jgi:hypothetical protein
MQILTYYVLNTAADPNSVSKTKLVAPMLPLEMLMLSDFRFLGKSTAELT